MAVPTANTKPPRETRPRKAAVTGGLPFKRAATPLFAYRLALLWQFMGTF